MTLNEYQDLLNRQRKFFTIKMQEAVEKQEKLSLQAKCAKRKWDEVYKSYRIKLNNACNKIFDKYPYIVSKINNENSVTSNITLALQESGNHEFDDIIEKCEEFPEFIECQRMDKELSDACFEYAINYHLLNSQIEKDRKKLFSEEYLSHMDKLADAGIFLYFLETPDFPLLDDDSEFLILDSFSFNNYMGTKEIFSSILLMENAGTSMKRKQEDISVALELMNNKIYRTAARNWFSLIESEHKKAAEAVNGFYDKKEKIKSGKDRSNKISEALQIFPLDWENHAWERIDDYYQKVVTNVSGYPNRNAVTHGDYEKKDLDINEHDCIKLLLLYLNLRLIADKFCQFREIFENFITMLPTISKLINKS